MVVTDKDGNKILSCEIGECPLCDEGTHEEQVVTGISASGKQLEVWICHPCWDEMDGIQYEALTTSKLVNEDFDMSQPVEQRRKLAFEARR